MNHRAGMFALLASIISLAPAFADEAASESSTLRDSAKATMSTAITAGKNLMGGLTEGVTAGREGAEGTDGSLSISALEQLQGKVDIELLRTAPEGDNLVATIGFKNESDQQLRLINLTQTGALIAIDKDGYSSALLPGLDNPDQVTIPPKVGVRQKFVFEGPVQGITAIRLWGKDFSIRQ